MTLIMCRFNRMATVACALLLLQQTHHCCGLSSSTSLVRSESLFSCYGRISFARVSPRRLITRAGPCRLGIGRPNQGLRKKNFQLRGLLSKKKDAHADSTSQDGPPWKNFKVGALHVHENFLDLFWYVISRSVPVLFAVQATALLALSISPEFGQTVIRFLVTVLLSIEKVLGTAINFLVAPIIIIVILTILLLVGPIALIRSLPNSSVQEKLMNNVEKPLQIMKQTEAWSNGSDLGSITITEYVKANPWFSKIQFVVIASVIEEVIFRGIILMFLKKVWKARGTNVLKAKETSTPTQKAPAATGPSEEPHILGYSPWALLSSLLFGLAHMSNWLGPLRGQVVVDTESCKRAMYFAMSAIAHFLFALFGSLRILTPIFEENGNSLAASIGAHAMWNLNTVTGKVTIPIRIIFRYLRWMINMLKAD